MSDDDKGEEGSERDGDLGDLLQELRVVQQAASLLVGFLLVASLQADFAVGRDRERLVYLATFLFAATSLVFLLGPPAWHRIQRPLTDRAAFKRSATRMMLAGQAALSVALALASGLAVTEAAGAVPGVTMAVLVGGLIGVLWWVLPFAGRRKAVAGRDRRGGPDHPPPAAGATHTRARE